MYPAPGARFTPLNHARGAWHSPAEMRSPSKSDPAAPARRADLWTTCRRAVVGALLVAAVGGASPAAAQFVLDQHEDLKFDRPEAWAMAWFSSVALPTSLSAVANLGPGQVELGLEGGWVPALSERERTVGFIGTKPEDLNRTDVFGRLRAAVGLPGRFTATVGWVPPATIGGIAPHLWSLAVERPLWQHGDGALSGRLYGQRGTFEGDITCPADAAGAGEDPDRNPYNCEQRSTDEMQVRMWGGELRAGTTLARWPALSPYVGVGVTSLHSEMHVDARYNGLIDHTVLETDGTFWSLTLGASYAVHQRWRLGAELYYSPLDVNRPDSGRSNDEVLNARLLLGWRVR